MLKEKQEKYLHYHQVKLVEYLAGVIVLLSDQSQIIKQAKFTYSPLWKALGKQTKAIKNVAQKQTKTIEEREKQILNTN